MKSDSKARMLTFILGIGRLHHEREKQRGRGVERGVVAQAGLKILMIPNGMDGYSQSCQSLVCNPGMALLHLLAMQS